MTRTSTYKGNAFATVNFDQHGIQVGFVMFPHSPHNDAWGVTRVPVAVIANGIGPTVIIEGGNHGDEYEGPIVISELVRELKLADISGRIILMPTNNVHAFVAGQRTSPIDSLNFNRVFPGDVYGTITQQIAAYLTDYIFPMGDAFIDLHSGGSSLDIMPSAIIEPVNDPEHRAKNTAAALAFGAPHTVIIGNFGDPRTATATASRHGLITVGTEMRGGGTVSLEALKICRQGVFNVLAHLGVLSTPLGQDPVKSVPNPKILELSGSNAHLYATQDGVFEPLHELGMPVIAGHPAGRIHRPWDLGFEPVTINYNIDGILYARRHPGRVMSGNCCLVVASPILGSS